MFTVQVAVDGKVPWGISKTTFATRGDAVKFVNSLPNKILINRDGHIYRVFCSK